MLAGQPGAGRSASAWSAAIASREPRPVGHAAADGTGPRHRPASSWPQGNARVTFPAPPCYGAADHDTPEGSMRPVRTTLAAAFGPGDEPLGGVLA